jgi:hypothetical protein
VYYDSLGWDPLYPSFYRLRGVEFTWRIRSDTIVHDLDSISTCIIYKIWFYIYLLNHLGSVPLGPFAQAEWVDSWRAPQSFPPSPGEMVPLVLGFVSTPECLASKLGLPKPHLPISGEVVECSIRLGMTHLSATWLWSSTLAFDRVSSNVLKNTNRCTEQV